MADEAQVYQVILNLCINAGHAMADGGKLTVRVEEEQVTNEMIPRSTDCPPGSYVKVTVSDTGTGIDEDTIDRIFDAMFTTKTESGGSGLGLAVVQRIVKNHNGFITVDSTPGKGTTFRVFFPCVVERSSGLSKAEAAEAA